MAAASWLCRGWLGLRTDDCSGQVVERAGRHEESGAWEQDGGTHGSLEELGVWPAVDERELVEEGVNNNVCRRANISDGSQAWQTWHHPGRLWQRSWSRQRPVPGQSTSIPNQRCAGPRGQHEPLLHGSHRAWASARVVGAQHRPQVQVLHEAGHVAVGRVAQPGGVDLVLQQGDDDVILPQLPPSLRASLRRTVRSGWDLAGQSMSDGFRPMAGSAEGGWRLGLTVLPLCNFVGDGQRQSWEYHRWVLSRTYRKGREGRCIRSRNATTSYGV